VKKPLPPLTYCIKKDATCDKDNSVVVKKNSTHYYRTQTSDMGYQGRIVRVWIGPTLCKLLS
jgi:hypothetical protein